eukprot:03152.XXX_10690_3064_1 [CDS] Oithona nana genome sequencing.
MSTEEEVKTEAPAAPEIIPAKSEDKLEIEKEEAEKKVEEIMDEVEKEKTEEDKKEDNKDEKDGDETEKTDEVKESTTEETEAATTEEEKKRFKLKTPKVPGFLRGKSKEREKQKDKAEGEEGKEEEGGEGTENTEEKSAKDKMKEALDNIHMPKMPKIPKVSKPAFLKKKKAEEGGAEAEEGEQDEGGEDKEKATAEDEEGKEETAAEGSGETQEAEGKEKKPGFLDNLKSQAQSLLNKGKSKDKDVEEGGDDEDKEESKELLEKKEEGEEGTAEGGTAEIFDGEPEAPKPSLLQNLRNVASQVFKSGTKKETTPEADKDVEAGEKEELLEPKEGIKGSKEELEEVKVVSETGEKGTEEDTKEKTDPEKPYSKYLNQAIEARDSCLAKYNGLERPHQLAFLATSAALLLLLFILIIVAIATPSQWTNYARISTCGKYVTTHTNCGPIQGLVEAHDQFSFQRIPYAVPVQNSERWTHSKAMTTLDDCHEGTLKAHSHNVTGSCWRRYPDGADGDENCLTLDIYTSSVVYADLKPVVVYIDGDDLSQDEEEALQPSASLAYNQSMVFVKVNYRRGVLGFLSLSSLANKSPYKSSGNYGLGDIIAALKWIQKNIQHFGGHPKQVTLLARGSGATLATALTAVPTARDLFTKAWVSNGAGVYENKTMAQANTDNKKILSTLNCRSDEDEVECLVDATAEDITEAIPYEWRDTNMPELPQSGEKEHSWMVIDKHLLLQHPKDFWHEFRMTNNIPMVFGATAQGEVTAQNKERIDWTNTDEFETHVESKLGSFNVTIPGQALKLYNVSDHWQEYASMISDIRTICPLQELADYVNSNFIADVYSYVATQKRSSGPLEGIADSTIDISAILGTYQAETEDEKAFVSNMQKLFASFVTNGNLPEENDMNLGMYVVDKEINTQRSYPHCNFWKDALDIVPTYAALD